MPNYIFNYATFYNYYTNPNNVITDKNDCVKLLFFNKSDKKVSKENNTDEKCNYIIIDGVKIYISETGKSNNYKDKNGQIISEKTYGLLFSIPTLIGKKLFDFHYHFGIRHDNYEKQISESQYINANAILKKPRKTNRTRKSIKSRSMSNNYNLTEVEPMIDKFYINPDEKLIYFHKTIQEPSKEIIGKGTMNHKDCYFQDNTRIQSINNIVCVNEDKTIMGKVIEDYNDRQLLKKIMMAPFVSIGGKRKTIKKIRK
jgi:hypothetical protein